MKHFTSIALVGAIAVSGALTATHADALPFDLSGTFTIDIVNYNPNANTDTNSRASAANFNNIFGATQSIGTVIETGTVEWVGTLNFNANPNADNTAPEDTPVNGTPIATISDFFASGAGGSLTGGIASLGTLAGNTLSAGGGQDDGGINDNARSNTTTMFRITAKSFSNISDMAQLVSVRHDDGMTLTDGTKSVPFEGPNGVRTTNVNTNPGNSVSGTNFTLYYAAANGNPSILQVQAIPLPAAAWMLLGVSGALIGAKRRKARKAA